MAGYRPKSLDDINQSYDSEMKVTRAIKRETSILSQNAPSVDDVFAEPKAETQEPAEVPAKASESQKQIEDVSSAVEDFIKQISNQKPSAEQPVIHAPEPVFEALAPAAEPKSAAPEVPVKPQPAPNVETEQIIPDPAQSRSGDDFSSLMSDYVKIMNDLDDDVPEKRSFLSRKRSKKKNNQDEAPDAAEENASANDQDLQPSVEPEKEPDLFDDPFDEITFKEPQSIAGIPEEEPDTVYSQEEKKAPEKEEEEDDDYYGSFAELLDEDLETQEPQVTEETKAPEPEKSKKSKKEKKAKKAKKDKKQESEIEEETAAEDISEAEPEAKKRGGARAFFRFILSIILVVCVLATLAVGSLGIVFHVNEGISAPGGNYFFTASIGLEQANIHSGDLVICSARNYANDSQSVVYVDRESKTFAFGIKNGSITGNDGEIYYVIGDNTIPRENVLGTVSTTIPTVGKVVSIIYSYYNIILVALLVLCIALFLVVTVALRNKNKNLPEIEEPEDEESSDEDLTASDEEDPDETEGEEETE